MGAGTADGSKVVLVTGAGGGLGEAAARAFAAGGARLVLTDLAEGPMRELAADLGEDRCLVMTADARDLASTAAVGAAAMERFGRIDVLINCAGGSIGMMTGREDPPIWELTPEEWDLVLGVNLTGSYHWIRAVVGPMMAQRSGHIVLIASGTAERPAARLNVYAAAKNGVVALTRGVSRELGPHGVRINAIHPGMTLHPKMKSAATDTLIEGYLRDAALDHLSTAEAFGAFLVHLETMDAVSGQVYNLDSRIL